MYPRNNIFDLWRRIGRVTPFEVRRFPQGRMTDWYLSQSVVVERVHPVRQYGEAFGFYLKDGKRDDGDWCDKTATEPQLIPCCGCGSWGLVSVQGDCDLAKQINEKEAKEVTSKIEAKRQIAIEEYEKITMTASDKFTFGKYRGITLQDVYANERQYVEWCQNNINWLTINLENLNSEN